jgi:hypothetical protein
LIACPELAEWVERLPLSPMFVVTAADSVRDEQEIAAFDAENPLARLHSSCYQALCAFS